MSQQKQAVADLFDQAAEMGALSAPVHDIVVANLDTSAMALAACQGADPAALMASEATIIAFVADSSASMSEVEDAVRESLMGAVRAIRESKGAEAVTLSLITFSDQVRVAFANKPVETIKQVTYDTRGMTALYDAMADAITGALAYEEQLLNTGIQTKVIIVVFSDGANNASRYATEAKVRAMAEDMRRRESWTLAFVGFETYETRDYGTDFRSIAAGAGFPAVITIDLTGDEYDRRHTIRETIGMVSQSVIRRSQTTIDPNAPPDDFFAV